MKKILIPTIALLITACQGFMNQATCYYFLKPGVSQEVCQTLMPVFNKHGLNTATQIKDYANFVKDELPKNKWKYGLLFATGTATGKIKTYLDTTKESIMALNDLAAKQKDPLKFTADVYSNAVEMGKLFR
ncbi:MAG: hypothetical protein JW812_03700 [Alphaproteobacteria bacterium]|nr:hypothetical protein [Alphaproteobacteria bacterium]MBN2779685.1 hypothetical protein [Alphaproteobacteria bacterium]